MSTVDKLNKVLETKQAIKEAIESKGQTVGDIFADYPAAIQNIQGGGGSGTFVVPKDIRFAYSTVEEFPEDWDWSEFEELTNVDNLFDDCKSLKTVPKLKFNDLQSAKNMFDGCKEVKSIDTSEWNTSGLKIADNMFAYSGIEEIPQIDFSNATGLTNIFFNCKSLYKANINTKSASNINYLFGDCDKLHTVSEINASNVTTNISQYSSPFYTCYVLRNFEGFEGLKVNMYISDCRSLSYESLMNVINKLVDGVSGKTLYLSQDCVNMLSDDDIAIATNKGWSISPARTITEPVIVTALSQVPSATYQITPKTYDFSQYSGSWLSGNYSGLPCRSNIYAFEADLSGTIDATRMFSGCNYLSFVKLFNTGGITNMSNMFNSAKNIINVDIDDTSNVTDMSQMFFDSYVDLKWVENLNVSKVVNFQGMFTGTLSRDGDTLDLSKWHFDSDNVDMKNMFYRTGFKHIILGDLSKVTTMESMFSTASNIVSNLKSITMKGPVSSTVNVTWMFSGVTTTGTFYYNPAYDYSKIIEQLPATWTAVPLTV